MSSPLTKDQDAKLRQTKLDLQIQNEEWLRSHPELETMLDIFTKQVLSEKVRRNSTNIEFNYMRVYHQDRLVLNHYLT
jgi:hypothetical protein